MTARSAPGPTVTDSRTRGPATHRPDLPPVDAVTDDRRERADRAEAEAER